MSEREIRKETDWLGNEKEVIYENGERVGEIVEGQRGGFLGIGAEDVRVEIDNKGKEVGYYKEEERGGFLGIGAETTEVRYSSDGEEESVTKDEKRGGFLGVGAENVKIEYDSETGEEISESKYEKRGGFLGIGAEWTRVTRIKDKEPAGIGDSSSLTDDASMDSAYSHPSASSGRESKIGENSENDGGIATRFEAAVVRIRNAKRCLWNLSDEAYSGPVNPTGIIASDDIAPDSPRHGTTRHYLVLAERVPLAELPSWADDGSWPPGTFGVVLAPLDQNLQLKIDAESIEDVDGLMLECAVGGTMESVVLAHEKSRNSRWRVIYSAGSAKKQAEPEEKERKARQDEKLVFAKSSTKMKKDALEKAAINKFRLVLVSVCALAGAIVGDIIRRSVGYEGLPFWISTMILCLSTGVYLAVTTENVFVGVLGGAGALGLSAALEASAGPVSIISGILYGLYGFAIAGPVYQGLQRKDNAVYKNAIAGAVLLAALIAGGLYVLKADGARIEQIQKQLPGHWRGVVGNNKATFVISGNRGKLRYRNNEEQLNIQVQTGGSIVLKGTGRLLGKDRFPPYIFQGTLSADGQSIQGTYKDTAGHRSSWQATKVEEAPTPARATGTGIRLPPKLHTNRGFQATAKEATRQPAARATIIGTWAWSNGTVATYQSNGWVYAANWSGKWSIQGNTLTIMVYGPFGTGDPRRQTFDIIELTDTTIRLRQLGTSVDQVGTRQ